MNKKMYQGAMRSILSELVRGERLVAVDSLAMDAPKTKDLIAKVQELAGTNDVLLVTDEADANLAMSARNVHKCEVLNVASLNPVSLVAHEKVVITQAAVEKIQEWLA